MSVIVKGLAMPESCEYCFFCMYMNCGYDVDYWCGIDNRPIENINIAKRLEDCPIVELPAHGDLIDRQLLRQNVLKWMPNDPCGIEEHERPFETDICVSMMMEIEEQPTVIKAEGSE